LTNNILSQSENLQEKESIEIDARNLPCPLPLLKLKQALNKVSDGVKITVFATDPASSRDFKAFVALTNHQLSIQKIDDAFKFDIIKQAH